VFYEVWGSSRGKAIHNHHQHGQEYLEFLKRMHGFAEFRLWKKQLECKYDYQL
jgi:hypothetical protein